MCPFPATGNFVAGPICIKFDGNGDNVVMPLYGAHHIATTDDDDFDEDSYIDFGSSNFDSDNYWQLGVDEEDFGSEDYDESFYGENDDSFGDDDFGDSFYSDEDSEGINSCIPGDNAYADGDGGE